MRQRAEVAEARASALQARVSQLEQEAPRPGSQAEGRAEGGLEAEGGQGQEERRAQVEGQRRSQEQSRAGLAAAAQGSQEEGAPGAREEERLHRDRLAAAEAALEESHEAERGLRARLAQVGVWCVCLGGGRTQVEASSPSLPPPLPDLSPPPRSPVEG